MSLLGSMRTSVAGMSAQSSRLSSVSNNIANASTTGYKRVGVEFESLVGDNSVRSYASGGVNGSVRYAVTEQGTLQSTSNSTDLAIAGSGFFIVQDASGRTFLTRAGSFVPDANGQLVNAAGYYLMGYDISAGDSANTSSTALTRVVVGQQKLVAHASTQGTFAANLPSNAKEIAAGSLPSTNSASSTYTAKSSVVTYDNLGNKITLDVYFAKTASNKWEMTVYNSADASSSGGFPYNKGPLSTSQLTFDGSTGALTSPSSVSLNIPNGATVTLDISKMTQLASDFSVTKSTMNGNAPSQVDHVEVSADGILSAVYADGSRVDLYRIPLATVASPDNLTAEDGNAFSESAASGGMVIGKAGSGGFGKLASSALEESTVDIASELTTMIEAQRGYSANSKVFQASADLLDVLMNMK